MEKGFPQVLSPFGISMFGAKCEFYSNGRRIVRGPGASIQLVYDMDAPDSAPTPDK